MALSPIKAIRERCKGCSETLKELRECGFTCCALYPYRLGKNPYWGIEKPPSYKPPLKAIRAYCLDCCLDQPKEVRLCPDDECAVYHFRFGKNPFASEAKRNQGRRIHSEAKHGLPAEDFQINSSQEGADKGVTINLGNTIGANHGG